jgi:photosystem II stability/assembly factor-like uncharacterized protein
MRIKQLCILAPMLCTLAGPALAGSFRWTNQGPEGGEPSVMVTNPASAELWLISAGLVFRFGEPASRWHYVPLDIELDQATALGFDPTDGRRVFIGTAAGRILRSTNGGVTFQATTLVPTAQVFGIAVDPFDPRNVLASVPLLGVGGVFRSTDGGTSWTRGGMAGRQAGHLIYHPDRQGQVYATTTFVEGGNLFFSKDGGASFELHGGLGSTNDPLSIDIGRPDERKNTFYAGVLGGAVKSVDGGRRWFDMGLRELSGTSVVRLEDRVLLGTSQGLYQTIDEGNTWTERGEERGFFHRRRINTLKMRGRQLVAGTRWAGVSSSLDLGLTWQNLNRGLSAFRTVSMDVDPVRGHLAVGVVFGAGAYRREAGGGPWEPVGRGMDLLENNMILVQDRKDPDKLYAGVRSSGASGVRMSADRGRSWVDISLNIGGTPPSMLGLHPEKEGPDGLLMGSSGGAARFSLPANAWLNAFPGTRGTPRVFAFDPSRPQRVFYGTTFGLYRSDDGGASVVDLSGPIRQAFGDPPEAPVDLAVLDIELDPRDPELVYVSLERAGTVWRSTRGGELLQPILQIAAPEAVTAIAVHPRRSQELYLGTRFNGVVVTKDGGRTIQLFGEGLSNPRIADLVFDRRDPLTLYARLSIRGVDAYTFGAIQERPLSVPSLMPFGMLLACTVVAACRMLRGGTERSRTT